MSMLKIGDVVVHKAGGPKMAVREISSEYGVYCDWFVRGKHDAVWFPPEVLVLADDDNRTPPIGEAK